MGGVEGQRRDGVHQYELQRLLLWLILAVDVPHESCAVRLVEKCVDQRVDGRRQVPNPNENVQQALHDLRVANVVVAHDHQHVGDEERAPHDHEEEKHDSQHLGCLLLVADGLHGASSEHRPGDALPGTTETAAASSPTGLSANGAPEEFLGGQGALREEAQRERGAPFGPRDELVQAERGFVLQGMDGQEVGDDHDG